jgi:hypothetical protein
MEERRLVGRSFVACLAAHAKALGGAALVAERGHPKKPQRQRSKMIFIFMGTS